MSTTTLSLEPRNIAASAQSLRAEFFKAKFLGVKAIMTKGAVHVEMPIARLADYQFACGDEHCSWTTSQGKIVLDLKGFSMAQHARKDVFVVVFTNSSGQRTPVGVKKVNQIREIFFQRSLRAIQELKTLDEQKLAEAVQAPTDYSVLVSALTSEEALANIRGRDPLAGARLRGLDAKRKLIEAEGGALSSAQAAKLLRISRQAIDKRRREGKLLAVELGKKGYHYPSWQFGLKGIENVLAELKERDNWEQLTFFLNPSAALDDRTPLDVLRQGKDNVSEVVTAASVYGEQGG